MAAVTPALNRWMDRFDSSVAGPQQFIIASPNPIPAPKKKGI